MSQSYHEFECENTFEREPMTNQPKDHLEVVRELVEAGNKASPGEWSQDWTRNLNENVVCNGAGDGQVYASQQREDHEQHNYDFIEAAGNARSALSALIAELEAARKVIAGLPRDAHGVLIQIGHKATCSTTNDMYIHSYQKIKGKWWVELCSVAIFIHKDSDQDFAMVEAEDIEVITEPAADAATKGE